MLDRTQLEMILDLYNGYEAKADKAFQKSEKHEKEGNMKRAKAQVEIMGYNQAKMDGVRATAHVLGYEIIYQRGVDGEYRNVIVEA